MTSMRIARGAVYLALLVGASACAGTREPSFPVPDDPGIYALTGNDLHRLDGDQDWETETWPERSNMPSNVQFVVSDPALAGRAAGNSVELWKVAWVRSDINAQGQAMPVAGSQWAVAPLEPFSIPFRYESPAGQGDVVHIVPNAPLSPGLYTVRIVNPGARQARMGVAWNGVDQRQYSAANCVDRYAAEGNIFRPCTSVVVPVAGVAPAPVGTIDNGGLASLTAPEPAPMAPAAPQPTPVAAGDRGLHIALVRPVRRNDGLLIQGVVTNTSSQVQALPTMQGSLENQAGQEVRRWVFQPPVAQLQPGQRANFSTEVRQIPSGVARASVAFIAP